jgi:hypothetical protein
MSPATPPPEVYQLHVWLREISPLIWRRLLVSSDSTIADLHYILQIGFNLAKTKILAKYNTVSQVDRLHGGTTLAHAVQE